MAILEVAVAKLDVAVAILDSIENNTTSWPYLASKDLPDFKQSLNSR